MAAATQDVYASFSSERCALLPWTPAVLLVDEFRAVGDDEFKQKCAVRIDAFRSTDVTVALVSHFLEQIDDLCGRAVWLEDGPVRALGEASKVADAYRADQGVGV